MFFYAHSYNSQLFTIPEYSSIGEDGVLRIVSQQTRSQADNRELAVERFAELLRAVLTPVPTRRKTRVGKAAKLRRLEAKKHRAFLKKKRSRKVPIEE